MRKAVLIWHLVCWLAVLQGLAKTAVAVPNPALTDTLSTGRMPPTSATSTPPPQIEGASLERRPQIEGRRPILITVPSLTGLSLDDARTTLLDADLQVGQITSAESRYEPGTVIQQSPEAATRVRRSTPVALVIANPIMIFVPPVTNRPMKDARSILSNAGLQIGTVTAVESDNEPGIVLEQSPEAGSRAPRGSSVSLAVSTPRMVNVPPVVGLELAAAREVLERSGLVPVTDAMHSQNDQALVTSQNPEPSSTVRRGSSVVLTLRAVAEPPAIEPPSPPALTPLPWTAIITGAAAITILAGALLFMRSIRTKPAPPAREPHVSIREKLDYGTQQVQATGNPEKAPTISITVRADQGDQEIRPS